MPDPNPDVAAVLAEGIRIAGVEQERNHCSPLRDAEAALAALTAENYAVVKLPEGVAVAHGARLVPTFCNGCSGFYRGGQHFAIEGSP